MLHPAGVVELTKENNIMIVYIYDKKTNKKKETLKNVNEIKSLDERFLIHYDNNILQVPKRNIKLVVYGF